MPGTALQPHSDNSGFTLSHIPRHNSVVQAIGASGQNVSHTCELAWVRGLHLHSLCFSVPGTQSSGATCFPCCHRKQLMWACVCHHCVIPPKKCSLSLQTVQCPTSSLPGIQSEFFINTTQAGPGTLSVTIEGPSKVKMDCQETPEGYKVMYTPMAPGNYLISVKYGGPNHILRSPFKAKVTGNDEPLWVLFFCPAEQVLSNYQ